MMEFHVWHEDCDGNIDEEYFVEYSSWEDCYSFVGTLNPRVDWKIRLLN